MPICPIHKVPYDKDHAVCMRKYMGIPDPGGPEAGDGMLPQDVLDELKKRGIAPRLSPTDTDAGDKRAGL
ncbi:MAG TPA: hypothetical protein VII69_10905 [Candidatus Eremiobacteraceae bacterium]